MGWQLTRRGLIKAGLGFPSLGAGAPLRAASALPIRSSIMLFTLKGTLEEKLRLAAEASLDAVELLWEWAEWNDAEIRRFRQLLQQHRLGVSSLVATPGFMDRPVSMLDSEQRGKFFGARENLPTSAFQN